MSCETKYTLRVLINDWVEEKPWELEGEHGLSFYIETPESKFLFDCGHTGAAWRNAVKMGVDLSEVELIVLVTAIAEGVDMTLTVQHGERADEDDIGVGQFVILHA